MYRQFLKIFSLTSIFILAASLSVQAQGLPMAVVGLDLTASTNNPIPGQSVTITAQSFSIDINSAKVVWSIGSKIIGSGIGLTKMVVTAPALGQKKTVDVVAADSNGLSVSNSITLGSGSVDLIVENDGYVPPFFLGKTPVVYQNSIKIVAMPHLADASGQEYNPANLVYKWSRNNSVLADQSGYDRQSITIQGGLVPRDFLMSVTVSTRDGSGQAQGIIPISFSSPQIVFYRNDPLYGPMFNSAMGDKIILGSQKELSALAVPYGFNLPNSGIGGLNLSWLINNILHNELSQSGEVTLRAPADTGGSSNISLQIESPLDILQRANAGFTVSWAKNSNGNTSAASFQ